jgi:hypothetical protein
LGASPDGRTLYFHVPQFGAVPLALSIHHDSIHYDLVPIAATSFDEICGVLDDTDRWMEAGPFSLAVRFVKSGLDVAFDSETVASYRRAMRDEASMAEFIDTEEQHQSNAFNMDW